MISRLSVARDPCNCNTQAAKLALDPSPELGLHGCGLLRGSSRPHESFTRIRSLHGRLRDLVMQQTCFVQWMQKSLDQINVRVHRAVSDLSRQTGMRIVRAIVKWEHNPEQ